MTYTGNVLYDNIDLTNPDTPMHVGKNSRLLGVSDKDYGIVGSPDALSIDSKLFNDKVR